MVTPTPYVRVRDYADFQAQNPDTEFNGSDFNGDFDGIKAATDSTAACLATIRKDDGSLKNQTVGVDQLKSEVISLLNGVTPRGDWASFTAYAKGDLVSTGGATYLCLVAHTSGTFATDLSAGKWMTMSALTAASSTSFIPAGDISATNVQAAIEQLDSEKQDVSAILSALAGLSPVANKLPYFTGSSAMALATLTAAAISLLGGTDAAAMRATLGAVALAGDTMTGELLLAANPTDAMGAAPKQYVDAQVTAAAGGVPAGTVVSYSGFTLPSGWLWANGATYGRAAKPNLYAATNQTGVATMTIATPCVVTWTAHQLKDNWPVKFTTTGALPTGLTAGTTYYLKSSDANTFQLAATPGGSAINTSGTQSGTHTAIFSPHGDGDGSTTFAVIDMRGRTAFGLDDMFAAAASRITSGTPKTIGASVGSETVVLTTGNLPGGVVTGGTTNLFGAATGDTNVISALTTGGSATGVNKLPPGIHVPWIVKA